MAFHILSTDIGLHDLLPEACISPHINSPLVQTSITLKAVQTPPSSPLPLSLVPSRPSAFPWICLLAPEVQDQARALNRHPAVTHPVKEKALHGQDWYRGAALLLERGAGAGSLLSPLWLLMAAMRYMGLIRPLTGKDPDNEDSLFSQTVEYLSPMFTLELNE